MQPDPQPTTWRSTPVCATEAMIEAGCEALRSAVVSPTLGDRAARRIVQAIVNAALKAAPKAPAMSPWLPIETAPKDGTEVLTLEGSGVSILSYDDHYNIWRDDGCDDCWDIHHPTHWMPLPEPPATGDDAHG